MRVKLKFLDEETFAFLLSRHEKRAYKEVDNAIKEFLTSEMLGAFEMQRIMLSEAIKDYKKTVHQPSLTGRLEIPHDDFDRAVTCLAAMDESKRLELRAKGPSVESFMAEALWVPDLVVYEKILNSQQAEVHISHHNNQDERSRLSQTHLSWIKVYPSGRVESYQIPLSMLIKPWSARYRKKGTYQVYRHTFFEGKEAYSKSHTYIGITKQKWQVRYSQHQQSARSGSPFLMHEAIRNIDKYPLMEHEVYAAGLSHEDAMAVEEYHVERLSLYPRGLNMIPGGFAGLRYLGLMNALRPHETGEFVDEIISDLMTGKRQSTEGQTNSLIAEHWRDPKYAEAVICNQEGRFSADEVRTIRVLGVCEWSAEKIAGHLNKSEAIARVKRLLKGRTYNRIV